jgi:small subunit ribosomal protein S20
LANTPSAEKRVRQAVKRNEHNRMQRSRLKTALKNVLKAEDVATARAAFAETSGLLDRFASRHLIHRNKAARKKSQLARFIAGLAAKS